MVDPVTSCFIGVVSHQKSAFTASQGSDGLGAQLTEGLQNHGVVTELSVRLEDEYRPENVPINASLIRRSIWAQFAVERSWLEYCHGHSWILSRAAVIGARTMRDAQRYLTASGRYPSSAGSRMMERLINIELSHLALFTEGLQVGSEWLLILEDDAAARDIEDLAQGLAALMTGQRNQASPMFVNLSHSFSYAELGIAHLLSPVRDVLWNGSAPRAVIQARKPVTNTVCAMLYRRTFAEQLLKVLESIPIDPVLPIDWKLNRALMQLYTSGAIADGDCWFIDPAPIMQMSMHGTAP